MAVLKYISTKLTIGTSMHVGEALPQLFSSVVAIPDTGRDSPSFFIMMDAPSRISRVEVSFAKRDDLVSTPSFCHLLTSFSEIVLFHRARRNLSWGPG